MTEHEWRLARRTFLGVAAAGALAACSPNPQTDGAATTGAAAPASDDTTTAATGAPAEASASTTAVTEAATTPATGAPSTATSAAAGGPAAFVPNGPRTAPKVSLTYHANGDLGLATRMLDILKNRGVQVTVFGVGNWMKDNPRLVARMLDEGHEVANHTWSHQAMRTLGRATVATEIARCADALTELTGSISPWFRPSGIEVPTPLILEEAGKAGYRTSVGYDVDSLDFQDPGATAVIANVKATVQPGSIISVHFGHQNTLDALPGLLDMLGEKGLQPVTVGQLLS